MQQAARVSDSPSEQALTLLRRALALLVVTVVALAVVLLVRSLT
jgi:hypothetical protein